MLNPTLWLELLLVPMPTATPTATALPTRTHAPTASAIFTGLEQLRRELVVTGVRPPADTGELPASMFAFKRLRCRLGLLMVAEEEMAPCSLDCDCSVPRSETDSRHVLSSYICLATGVTAVADSCGFLAQIGCHN